MIIVLWVQYKEDRSVVLSPSKWYHRRKVKLLFKMLQKIVGNTGRRLAQEVKVGEKCQNIKEV